MTELNPGEVKGMAITARKTAKQSFFNEIWAKALISRLQKCQYGRLQVVLPNGEVRFYGPPDGQPPAKLYMHSFALARRMALGGVIGLAESYMAGEWDTPDMTALFVFATRNKSVLQPSLKGTRLTRLFHRLFHLVHANTRGGSRRNIAYHYDLGNEFYKQWLDPSMTYSSGIYEEGDDLSVAQKRKYERICQLAELSAGQSVLEVGCGWGSFAREAVTQHGVDVTGLTLSHEQKAYADMQNQDIADQARFCLTDYRDAKGQYDRLVSIEMFEAVGEENWPHYFQMIKDRLKPDGAAVLQIISIKDEAFERYRRSADFIQRYIFPGGMLPSRTALHRAVEEAGLILEHEELFGQSYAVTLARWKKTFLKAWPEIEKLGFDDRFKRMWSFYLSYCEAGFLTGQTDVGFYKIRRP